MEWLELHIAAQTSLETHNISELSVGVLLLDPLPVRVRIEEERAHIPLRLVGILLGLLLARLLCLLGRLLLLAHRIEIFVVGAHGRLRCWNEWLARGFDYGALLVVAYCWRNNVMLL
jgi:hypothetical protein